MAENGNLGPAVEASHAIAALCGTYILLFMYLLWFKSYFLKWNCFFKKATAHESVLAMETATSQSAIKQDQSSAITIVLKLFRKINFIFTFFCFLTF